MSKTLEEEMREKIAEKEKNGKKIRKQIQKLISDNEIKKIMHNEVKIWKAMANDMKTEGLNPMLNIFIADKEGIKRGAIMMAGAEEIWNGSHDEKVYGLFRMGMAIGEQETGLLAGVLMGTECWYLKASKKSFEEQLDGYNRIGEHPNRVEGINLVLETADYRTAGALINISRDKKNVIDLSAKPTYTYSFDNKGKNGFTSDMLTAFFDGFNIGQIKKEMGA